MQMDAMDNNVISNVTTDAVLHPAATYNASDKSCDVLDSVMEKLSKDDYKSIFFLLMDTIGPRHYLHIVNQDIEFLKREFREVYYNFPRKKVMLIELLGTMKKFSLLRSLQSCCSHVVKTELHTFTQIDVVWKILYDVCEQLSCSQVAYLRGKLLPNSSTDITCAEQLLCEAWLEGKFEKANLSNLKDIFQGFHSDCYHILSSYEGVSRISYYPIKRPTKNSPCGHAVILNHEKFYGNSDDSILLTDRPDSHRDACSLKKLWESFGFITRVYCDLKHEEVFSLFSDLAKLDHSSYDAFVVCILSHGDQGVFFASDCVPISLLQLVNIIANNCLTLLHAPKLFFVEACQGSEVQEGVYKSNYIDTHPRHVDIAHMKVCMDTPVSSDVLIAFSTIEGYTSFVPSGKNSWFIAALVQEVENHGEVLTMDSILTKVADVVSRKTGISEDENGRYTNCKQTVMRKSNLRRELKLKRLLV